jgi:NAD(P)-dependent dehydrogenase (short-subunit alcohol dehydrogenase family)
MTDALQEVLRTRLSRDAILLTGKRAVVTGGAGGIGRGIAIGLAEFGADVAIIDIDDEAAEEVAALIRGKGRKCAAINANVIERDNARAGLAAAIEALGGVDILVNNAGGSRPIRLVEMTDRQVDRQIDFNMRSLIALIQMAAKDMIERGQGGAIINVASIEGFRAAPTYAVYSACKAGMLNLTRTLALELGEHGIRINAIAPDVVPTAHLIRFSPTMTSEEGKAAQAKYIPLERMGNLDDCAGAAVFLASPMASYITGTTLHVDGGTWASSGWNRSDAGGWSLTR